jgi:hypothetical protein
MRRFRILTMELIRKEDLSLLPLREKVRMRGNLNLKGFFTPHPLPQGERGQDKRKSLPKHHLPTS